MFPGKPPVCEIRSPAAPAARCNRSSSSRSVYAPPAPSPIRSSLSTLPIRPTPLLPPRHGPDHLSTAPSAAVHLANPTRSGLADQARSPSVHPLSLAQRGTGTGHVARATFHTHYKVGCSLIWGTDWGVVQGVRRVLASASGRHLISVPMRSDSHYRGAIDQRPHQIRALPNQVRNSNERAMLHRRTPERIAL